MVVVVVSTSITTSTNTNTKTITTTNAVTMAITAATTITITATTSSHPSITAIAITTSTNTTITSTNTTTTTTIPTSASSAIIITSITGMTLHHFHYRAPLFNLHPKNTALPFPCHATPHQTMHQCTTPYCSSLHHIIQHYNHSMLHSIITQTTLYYVLTLSSMLQYNRSHHSTHYHSGSLQS